MEFLTGNSKGQDKAPVVKAKVMELDNLKAKARDKVKALDKELGRVRDKDKVLGKVMVRAGKDNPKGRALAKDKASSKETDKATGKVDSRARDSNKAVDRVRARDKGNSRVVTDREIIRTDKIKTQQIFRRQELLLIGAKLVSAARTKQ